jgi:hypothetical protein
MNRTAVLAAAVLMLAACSSSKHTASVTAPTAAASAPASSPAPTLPAGVTLSIGGQSLPKGPFQITPLSCGPYTAAQRSQNATSAAGGLTYSYTNTSNTLAGAPSVSVDFTSGPDVMGHNVTHALVEVDPGQTSQGIVDALTGSGGDLSGYDCEVMGYSVGYSPAVTFAP